MTIPDDGYADGGTSYTNDEITIIENSKDCPNCGCMYLRCPECGKMYYHGMQSHCDNPACIEINAPLDCRDCLLTTSNDCKGVLTLDMELMPYNL